MAVITVDAGDGEILRYRKDYVYSKSGTLLLDPHPIEGPAPNQRRAKSIHGFWCPLTGVFQHHGPDLYELIYAERLAYNYRTFERLYYLYCNGQIKWLEVIVRDEIKQGGLWMRIPFKVAMLDCARWGYLTLGIRCGPLATSVQFLVGRGPLEECQVVREPEIPWDDERYQVKLPKLADMPLSRSTEAGTYRNITRGSLIAAADIDDDFYNQEDIDLPV